MMDYDENQDILNFGQRKQSAREKNFVDKRIRPVLVFFGLTFLWTWLAYLAIILNRLDPYKGMGMALLILGGCSPTFVGLGMAMATGSRPQRLEYLKRIWQAKRISRFWWAFLILLFPLIIAASIAMDLALGGALPQMANLKAVIANPVVFFPLVLLSFMSGPFSEELGWRGFALDPLLERFGFTNASILLGIVWGVWHLPLYFMPQTWHGQMGFRFEGFWLFILMSIGLSNLMSLVHLRTGRSILSAMLMHLGSNFTAQLVAQASPRLELIRGLMVFLIGAGICVYMARSARSQAHGRKAAEST